MILRRCITLLLMAASTSYFTVVLAEDDIVIENIVIIGSKKDVLELPGSGGVIDQEQMTVEVMTDINQALKTVPGVYIREEDGNGLRPNIGIRGATAERSGKITLLEDGVLIAPAPYSNPAAYYFPTIKRISTIELLKGAPLLRYGPHTTGGVINLISTPIPDQNEGSAEIVANERGSSDVHVYWGGTHKQWRYLFEGVDRRDSGFKTIDRSRQDTGFRISDFVAKLGWESEKQNLLLKIQQSNEQSNATYLGLTDADFQQNPNRRYGLSSIDVMNNDHLGYSLQHNIELTPKLSSSLTLYRNEFNRDWFKLSNGDRFINAANQGDQTAQGILDGTIDVAGLTYKHNNRSYVSQGIELNFDILWNAHEFNIGGRLHEDEMDRFQPDEIVDQVNGSLVFQRVVTATNSNNRLEDAKARSLWFIDSWQASDALNINLALRYENVKTRRRQFAFSDRRVVDKQRSNSNDQWLAGVSFTYDISEKFQILAGYHQGFSPLGGSAKTTEEPETSDNFELGGRFQYGLLLLETVGFYSDFSNKRENCSLGSPCSNGATSGSFANGNATISGVEFKLGTQFNFSKLSIPFDISYTATRGEISMNVPGSEFLKGDHLKDIPENLFSVRTGIELDSQWNSYAVLKFIDTTCVRIACNRTTSAFDKNQSLWVLDLISRYQWKPDINVFVKIENLLDTQKIISRLPDGARPNKPFTISAGMVFEF